MSTKIRRIKTAALPAKPRPDTLYDTPAGLFLGDEPLGGSTTLGPFASVAALNADAGAIAALASGNGTAALVTGVGYFDAIGGVWVLRAGANSTDEYVGHFSTNVAVMTSTIAAGTATQLLCKKRHVSRDTVSFPRFAWPNWLVPTSTLIEGGNGGSATITASIEYPIGSGNIMQCTWSGATSVAVASGAQSPLCDPVPIRIPRGAAYFTRVFYTNASGLIVLQASGNTLDVANGEVFRYSTGSLTDQTMSAAAWTGGTNNTNLSYGPILCVASMTRPSVLVFGDSRAQGINDTFTGNLSGDKGAVPRALGSNYSYVNCGVANDSAASFLTSNTLRVALAKYFSHIICEYGYNDIFNGASAATLVTRQQSIAALFGAKPTHITTIPPGTTGAWTLVDRSDQTARANQAANTTYNGLVRAGVSGVAGFFEFADVAEGGRNLGTWLADGTTNKNTTDGIHETQVMNLLYASANVISPSAMTR